LFLSISERNNQIKYLGFLRRNYVFLTVTIFLLLLLSPKANVEPDLQVGGTSSVSTTANYVLILSVVFLLFNI
jgi:hypothetical protein